MWFFPINSTNHEKWSAASWILVFGGFAAFGCSVSSSGSSSDSGLGTEGDPDTDAPGTGTGHEASTTGSSGPDDDGSDAKFDVGAPDGTEADPCEALVFKASTETPEIMLVLDLSGSMSQTWDFNGLEMTRWDSLYLTVEAVLGKFAGHIEFGTELYPTADFEDYPCLVDDPVTIPVAPDNDMNILATIPSLGHIPKGGTPMGSGLDVARTHLAAIKTTKPQTMILVADGRVTEGCLDHNTPEGIVALLEEEAAAGVPTYVVGVAVENYTFEQLNLFAIAGGVPLPGAEKFYNAQDGAALLVALGDVVEGVLGCSLTLDPPPELPELTEVEVDGVDWPQVTDCDTEDGWIYSDPFSEITLCGQACQDLKENLGQVDITYPCPPDG